MFFQIVDPKGITFENYISAFKEMNYVRAFGYSLLITSISIVFIILFSSMAAYFFVRNKNMASKTKCFFLQMQQQLSQQDTVH